MNGAQMYQQSSSSPPMIHNPLQQPNYQQMVMYGYRPQDQFQFQPQTYGNFMQPEFMMQQPLWNNQSNPSQWMPVMTPQNFGYHPNQYFSPNQQAPIAPPAPILPLVPVSLPNALPAPVVPAPIIEEKEKLKSALSDVGLTVQPALVPKPPSSSPPPRVKSPRKVESAIGATDTTELSNPISAILAELPDPQQLQQQFRQDPIATTEPVEKVEKETKKSRSDLIDAVPTAEESVQASSNNPITPIPPPATNTIQEPASAIRQNVSAPPIPYIVSQEVEQQRLAAMHALGILNTDERKLLILFWAQPNHFVLP